MTRTTRLLRYVWRHPGNRGRRLRALWWLVFWQLWQRTVRRPLTLRVAGAMRMKCHPHSNAAALVLYCRLPEWQHMSFVRDFLRPGDCFVDVGANVGSYSLLAAATPGSTVLSFEPSTLAYRRLQENIALNDEQGRICARQMAIGAGAGEARISVGKDAVNRVLSADERIDHEMVPMGALDEIVPTSRTAEVRLVKVDVEGAEVEVLRGAASLLASAGPVVIAEANDVAAVRAVLEPLGYGAYAYDPDRHQVEAIDWFDVHDNNILAIRDPAPVRERLATGEAGADQGAVTGIGRRISWMVVDQGLSSLSNVATSIVAARALSPPAFGAFALAVVIYGLVLGVTRGTVTEVLVSLYSHRPAATLRRTLRAAAGSAVDLGVVAAIGVAAVAAAVGGATWTALGALALVLPGLVLQDAWRYCFVASGRPRAAVFNDALWCAVQAAAVVVLLGTGRLTLLGVVVWWGASGTVAGVAGCFQAGLLPSPASAARWIAEHRELSWRYATEYGVATGAGQAALVLLGGIAGLAALGAVRGALVFYGAIVVLYNGAFLAVAAEGVRLRSQPAKLRRLMECSSMVMVAVAAASLAVGVVLPDQVGRALFGATWRAARAVIVPVGVATVANCAAAGAVIGLRALAAARASLRARLITAPLAVVGPLVGAAWGARGFAIGLAIACGAGMLVWWRQFVAALAADRHCIDVGAELVSEGR